MAIAKFSLAVGEKYKDKENTSFFNCVLFGKTAENLITYLTKGKQVCVVGKLKQDRWEKDGAKKSSISIVVNSLQFLQNGKDEQKPSKQEEFAPENFEGDDILF
jgi:single-strand DNA-binding protein